MFTLDVGYGVTGSCRSAITYLDGEQGVLLHRGYPIEQLAEKSSFLEVAYLLIHGELPNAQKMEAWNHAIKMHSMTHEHLQRFYSGYRYDAHPMSVLTGVVGAVASFYHDGMDVYDADERLGGSSTRCRTLCLKSIAINLDCRSSIRIIRSAMSKTLCQ